MIIFEFKAKGKASQYQAIDEAIRTSQFIRNKCIRYWMDNRGVSKADLSKYTKVLARQFAFASNLNAMSRQASAERAWQSIARFYDNCKKKVPGKKAENAVLGGSAVLRCDLAPPAGARGSAPREGSPQVEQLPWSPQVKRFSKTGFPKFKKHSRSVEYKTQCWKLLSPKRIHFKEFGVLKLVGTYDLAFYPTELIKRVRVVRRADGYYVQFCIKVDVKEEIEPSKQVIGLDVGLEYFYTDSNGNHEENPRFYRKNEKKRSRLNRRFSRTQKGMRSAHATRTKNRAKARIRLAKLDLVLKSLAGRKPTPPTFRKISRQRIEHAKRLARCVIHSNDVIVYENLQVKDLVRNRKLAKSISDAGWYQFRRWLEYFGKKFGKVTVAVEPHFTSQECSSCGKTVKKSLSTRWRSLPERLTHKCSCGCELQRDYNAALNILKKGLGTVGHIGTLLIEQNASEETASLLMDFSPSMKADSLKEESSSL